MKPKTFTYNQMIQFFTRNNMPLTEQQVRLVASFVKAESEKLEEYRERRKEKRDRDFIKREKKKLERKANREKIENYAGAPENKKWKKRV